MATYQTNSACLVIEDTLQILEECIQCSDTSCANSTIIKQHIQRLKYHYSPWFDFTHAESGSYFYAALHCMNKKYFAQAELHNFVLSQQFCDSMSCLTNVGMYALNLSSHQSLFIEDLIRLGHIWQCADDNDMRSLLVFALQSMRKDFNQSNQNII